MYDGRISTAAPPHRPDLAPTMLQKSTLRRRLKEGHGVRSGGYVEQCRSEDVAGGLEPAAGGCSRGAHPDGPGRPPGRPRPPTRTAPAAHPDGPGRPPG